MRLSFAQNEFFPKRFLYARPQPKNADEGTAEGGKERFPKPEPVLPKQVDESRQKISDLLDDKEKAEKLIGAKEGQPLSPKDILSNLKKVVREDQASSDWVLQTYRDFYPEVLRDGVTPAARQEIAHQEYERFKRTLSESGQERIQALVSSERKPTYTEALQAILSGTSAIGGGVIRIGEVDKGTRDVIASLRLDNTKTVQCHEKAKEIKKLEEQIASKKTELIKYDQEIREHQENRGKISEWKEWWSKNKWEWNKMRTVMNYTGKIALIGVGVVAVGGFGAGLLGLSTATGFGTVGAGFSTMGSWFASIGQGIWSGYSGLAAGLGMSKPAVAAAAGLGIGLYSWVPGFASEWINKEVYGWKKSSLAKKKEEEKKALGIDELEDQRKAAEAEMKNIQEENKSYVDILQKERGKYVDEQNKINGLIEQRSESASDLADLQQQLAKVTAYILNLDAMIDALNSANNPGSVDTALQPLSMDEISRNIQKMNLDATRTQQLMQIAADREKEWRGSQQKLMDVRFKEGILKEKNAIDDPDLLHALTAFLDPNGNNSIADKWVNKLRAHHPELHRLVRSMKNLKNPDPQGDQMVLFKEIRDILHPIFEEAEKDLHHKEEREAVMKAFNRLPEDLRNYAQNRSQAIYDAWESFHSGEDNPFPRPERGQSFEKWIKNFNAEQLENMLKLLEDLRSSGVVERNKIVDKVGPVKSKIEELFNAFTGKDEPIQGYLEEKRASGLEKISSKLGTGQTFQLSSGDSFLDCIKNTNDKGELIKVRDLLGQMKHKIEIDEDIKEPELSKPLNDEIHQYFMKIEKKDQKLASKIFDHPELLTHISNDEGRNLPDPSAVQKYKSYRDSLNYSNRKILRDVLKIVLDQDYGLNKDESKLELNMEKVRNEIGVKFDEIQVMISSVIPTENFTRDKLVHIWNKVGDARRMPKIPTKPTFKDSLTSVEKKEDLEFIHQKLNDIFDSCFFSRKQNHFELIGKLESDFRTLFNSRNISDQNRLRLDSDPNLLRLNRYNHTADLPEPTGAAQNSLSNYFHRQLEGNFNAQEAVIDVLGKISRTNIPEYPDQVEITGGGQLATVHEMTIRANTLQNLVHLNPQSGINYELISSSIPQIELTRNQINAKADAGSDLQLSDGDLITLHIRAKNVSEPILEVITEIQIQVVAPPAGGGGGGTPPPGPGGSAGGGAASLLGAAHAIRGRSSTP